MGKKILLIEDDLSVVEMLKKNLEKSDYEVSAAFDGIEGVKMAQQKKPDLIILDVMLPKEDGFSVLEQIKNSQDIAYTPIIIISGLSSSEIKEKIPSYEAQSKGSRTLFFLRKPFDIEELLTEIESFFNPKIEWSE